MAERARRVREKRAPDGPSEERGARRRLRPSGLVVVPRGLPGGHRTRRELKVLALSLLLGQRTRTLAARMLAARRKRLSPRPEPRGARPVHTPALGRVGQRRPRAIRRLVLQLRLLALGSGAGRRSTVVVHRLRKVHRQAHAHALLERLGPIPERFQQWWEARSRRGPQGRLDGVRVHIDGARRDWFVGRAGRARRASGRR